MVRPAAIALTVTKLGARIGARIDGVRLGGDLDPGVVDQLHAALLRHKVIFFRDQHHLDDERHFAFAKRLGAPIRVFGVNAIPGGPPGVSLVDSHRGKATRWHTDHTFTLTIPRASILRAVTLPSYGGSTLWASTAAAYASLPTPLKHLTENLWALHSGNRYDQLGHAEGVGTVLTPGGTPTPYHALHDTNMLSNQLQAAREEESTFRIEHPVVRVHPGTGERALLLGQWARGFIGLENYESQLLFEMLQRRITLPENTIRWDWQPGDVAIWDNYATQHRAVDDYDDEHRLMHRVALIGEVPVDIHGRRSRQLSGRTPESIADEQAR
ncbi:TauD/TfdA dioxygenase family protein [Mycobacterium stomatepiae]|uniref:Alpha-ketoglutarate-dependent sulfate ester dioxygenase n=1 Tax=Mycobacterium stomatepiae TaxID=470076 RepID=A0A7I7QCB3_9MYCO|nr:TauD/TfdA family dioxygenase [Mycobacterium stomatepiae]MCV7166916.1 TauD/TfdA family dioxygenase [Mycobacterium stomatepiae]BBY23801.1 alpha-ketoglutarate-dependent sulfate ester dioxygenase [Mycobacterium stomatepiae]